MAMFALRSICIVWAFTSIACRQKPQSPNLRATATSLEGCPDTAGQKSAVKVIHLAPNQPIRAVSLVDSTLHDFGEVGRSVYGLALHHDSSIDTLPNLVTIDKPTLVGDSLLLGIAYDSTADDFLLFCYSERQGQINFYAPLEDLRLAVSIPSFSPDGEHLALRYQRATLLAAGPGGSIQNDLSSLSASRIPITSGFDR